MKKNISTDNEEPVEPKRRKLDDPSQSADEKRSSTSYLKKDIAESIKKLDEKILKARGELKKYEVEFDVRSKAKAEKLKDIGLIEEKVHTLCGDREFEDVLMNQKEKAEKLRKEHSILEAKKVLYDTFIDQIENKSSCPLCCTSLESKRKIDLLDQIKHDLQTLPTQVEEIDRKFNQANVDFEKLLELKPSIKHEEDLKSGVVDLEAELKRIHSEIDEKELSIRSLIKDKKSAKIQQVEYLSLDLTEDRSTLQELLIDIDTLQKQSAEKQKLEKEMKATRDQRQVKHGRLESLKKIALDEYNFLNEALKAAGDVLDAIISQENKLIKEIKDLKTLRGELEQEQLQLHEENMKKVNEMIKKLWKKIYRGKDITNIRIHSYDENRKINVDNRRSYDYCVMQTVDGKESEMRNRCSSGQKILACLIIRLALAIIFKCPAIVIDEPTAYLDTSNMLYLSQTLRDIAARIVEGDRKFTLIIMSVNEKFLRRLQQNDYYMLSRDGAGKSRITRKSFE